MAEAKLISQGKIIPQGERGKEMDVSGLYYFGARYYDPRVGRFTSADATALLEKLTAGGISKDEFVQLLVNPQAWNLYSYALNNPFRYVDPTGKFIKEIQQGIENGAQFTTGYFTGAKDAFVDSVNSLAQTVAHPIDTAINIIKAAPYILELAASLKNEAFQLAEDLQSEDYYSSGYAAGKTITAVLMGFAVAKGVKKFIEEAKGFKSFQKIQEKVRHQSFINQLAGYTDTGVMKAIRNFERKIFKHENKIKLELAKDNADFGDIQHWQTEIKVFKEQLQLVKNEAEKRGLNGN